MAERSSAEVERLLEEVSAACSRENVRLTELRRTVLELVLQSERPCTAYQLLDRLRAIRAGAAPPTVYRALDFLVERKIIHKLERLNAYVACTGAEPHAHRGQFLICAACGGVTELEDHRVARALEQAAADVGFRPSSTVVEVDGVCAGCAPR